MSLFRRLSTTVSARLDQLVSQIENHDAVAESVIRDIRQEVARAKVRLNQVKQDGGKLRRQLNELKQQQTQWQQRACTIASEDETKALECVRRSQQCAAQIKHLQLSLQQHVPMEQRLISDINRAEQRLAEITRQRHHMRARQSAAESRAAIQRIDQSTTEQLEDVFDRWEVSVTETELATDTHSVSPLADELEQSFVEAEEEADLKAALAELLANEAPTNSEDK